MSYKRVKKETNQRGSVHVKIYIVKAEAKKIEFGSIVQGNSQFPKGAKEK